MRIISAYADDLYNLQPLDLLLLRKSCGLHSETKSKVICDRENFSLGRTASCLVKISLNRRIRRIFRTTHFTAGEVVVNAVSQGKNTRGRRVNSPWKGPKEPRKMAENTYSRATQDLKTAPVNKLHLCNLYTIAVLRSDMY